MKKPTSKQLRLATVSGMSVRASFDGGAMSSDFGAVILAGVDRQTGMTQRLASAFKDRRHVLTVTAVTVPGFGIVVNVDGVDGARLRYCC